jgi:hypothetical protein
MLSINLPEYPVEPFIEPAPASYASIERALRKIGDFRLVWGGSETEYWAGFRVMRHPITRYLVETVEVCPNPEAEDPDWIELPRDTRAWSEQQRTDYGHLQQRVKRCIFEAGDPSWYIELRLDPKIACRGWEDNRWLFRPGYFTADPVTGLVDLKGEPPREGGWVAIMKLADEHGLPRAPGQADVEAVKRYQRARLEDPDLRGWRHDEEMPAERLHDRVARVRQEIEEHDQREFEAAKERIRDIASHYLLGQTERSFPTDLGPERKETTDE